MQQPLIFDPGSDLDLKWDWTAWLAADGDNIASFAIATSIGLSYHSTSQTQSTVVAWVKPVQPAPPVGSRFFARCTITTDSAPPRVDTRSIVLQVQPR